jgi:isopentenyl-diphosphate delta-isomerase
LSEIIISVDEQDGMTGTLDKMQAHIKGKLHRAFSIFVFNANGEPLLQQRAEGKYHSGGKWTNTCCGHPRVGEQTKDAAHRRLQEEMGFDCELKEVFSFRYYETLENGLIENEFDHVFFGVSNLQPVPEPLEVKGFKYVEMNLLALDLKAHPERFTVWLNICFEQVMEHFKQMNYETSNY